jgi:hypothetical protein
MLQTKTSYLTDEVDPILRPIIHKLVTERPQGGEHIRRAIAETALGPHPALGAWGSDQSSHMATLTSPSTQAPTLPLPAAAGSSVEDSLREEIARLQMLLTPGDGGGSKGPKLIPGEYHRIQVAHPDSLMVNGHHKKGAEEVQACAKIARARSLRGKYVGSELQPQDGSVAYGMVGGVMRLYANKQEAETGEGGRYACASFKDFCADYEALVEIVFDGPTKSFCGSRLKLMETKFEFHKGEYECPLYSTRTLHSTPYPSPFAF